MVRSVTYLGRDQTLPRARKGVDGLNAAETDHNAAFPPVGAAGRDGYSEDGVLPREVLRLLVLYIEIRDGRHGGSEGGLLLIELVLNYSSMASVH